MRTDQRNTFHRNVQLCALLLGFSALATSAWGAAVVNGSFEADIWSPTQFDLETSGLTGWTALDPGNASPLYPWGINNSTGYGPTPYGSQFVVLGGFGGDMGTSIQQTLSGLTSGNAYTLSFALATEGYLAGFGAGNSNVRVNMLAGSTTPSADYAAPPSLFNYWDTWGTFTYTFTANSTSATFAFEDRAMTGNGYDIGIDNVSISDAGVGAVPELSSCCMAGVLVLLASWKRGQNFLMDSLRRLS